MRVNLSFLFFCLDFSAKTIESGLSNCQVSYDITRFHYVPPPKITTPQELALANHLGMVSKPPGHHGSLTPSEPPLFLNHQRHVAC